MLKRPIVIPPALAFGHDDPTLLKLGEAIGVRGEFGAQGAPHGVNFIRREFEVAPLPQLVCLLDEVGHHASENVSEVREHPFIRTVSARLKLKNQSAGIHFFVDMVSRLQRLNAELGSTPKAIWVAWMRSMASDTSND